MKNNKISEIGNDVAFGENGSRILVLSTIFEFRNPDGTDLAIVRAKSPVNDNDVATRKFVLDEIANVSSPDLSGYATVVYVNNQDGITLSNANAYTDNEILAINTVLTSHDNRITALENNPSSYTSPISTKGDIFVGNSLGDDARLPVGLNGQVLEADSTQPNGLRWQDKPDLSVYETIANVDSKDAAVLAAANNYTDQEIANIGGGGGVSLVDFKMSSYMNFLPQNNAPENVTYTSVLFAGNKFLACASGGTFRGMFSTNGESWFPTSLGVGAWNSLAFGNGLYVAITSSNVAARSFDGQTWLPETAINRTWRALAFGNNRFVAVCDSGDATTRVMYSSDGVTWLAGSTPNDNACDWRSIAFGNGVFVAVSSTSVAIEQKNVMYSTDGITWQKSGYIMGNGWTKVVFGNGFFIASASGKFIRSTDGINWTYIETIGLPTPNALAYGDGFFIAQASNNLIYISSDNGLTWKLGSIPTPSANSIAFGKGKFVSVGTQSTTIKGIHASLRHPF